MSKLAFIGLCGLSMSLLAAPAAKAGTFNISSDVTFEVIDGGFGIDSTFDSKGNLDKVFPGNFDITLLGTLGEASQNAEFRLSNLGVPQEDLTNLPVPAREVITEAVLRVTTLPNEVFGLGVGEKTDRLAVRGYVGNGQPDASDFEAGTVLDVLALSAEPIEEILDFDVTDFIAQALDDDVEFSGFSVRAETLGGVLLQRDPRLIVTARNIGDVPPVQSVPEPSSALAILAVVGFSVGQRRVQRKAMEASSAE